MQSNSTAPHERAYQFMNEALELRMLFTIIARLAENPRDRLPNDKTDPELKYIARQGERLAQKLNVNLDGFSMDLQPEKEVCHG